MKFDVQIDIHESHVRQITPADATSFNLWVITDDLTVQDTDIVTMES